MRWLSSIGQDLRQAGRALRAARGFTVVAVLTLALGIGANTAVFSVVNALLFRPLPVSGADRLTVLATSRAPSTSLRGFSYPDLQDYRAATGEAFEDIAGYIVGFAGLAPEGGSPARVLVTWVTGNYFPFLGLTPAAGGLIQADEVRPGRVDPVAVLGYETWRRRFGADPAVVGRKVLINGHPCTVVGIAPRGFAGTFAFSESEVYLPLNWATDDALDDRDSRPLHTIARLRPGVTIDRASAVLGVVAARLDRLYPETNAGVRITVVPERLARPEEDNSRSNGFGATMILLLVGLVFVAAEVNVMNLLLARAAARRRELAIRVAIGASRGRLVQQLVTETAVLAALGGAAGILLAWWVTAGLAAIRLPGSLPVRFDFHADTRVLAYALALTFLTAATIGVLAALRASRVNVDAALRNRGSESARRRGVGVRGALVIAQTATCFVLLVAAAMFTRSLGEARHMDLGFEPRGVLNVQMDVAHVGYEDARGRAFYEEVERRVRRLPGANDVSYAFSVPMGYVRLTTRVAAQGRSTDSARVTAGMNIVGPDYFAVMGIPVVRGRAFDGRDTERTSRVAVVNVQFAQALWPGQDPVGRRFTEGAADAPLVEVVGLAATSKYRLLFEEPAPYFYMPMTQHYTALRVLHVRTASDPDLLAPAIERTIHELEPALPLYDVQSMTNALEGGRGFFLVRTAAMFSVVLGSVAAALAIVGLYGVVSCMANDRSREIGIRLALGATARNVARVVLLDGAVLAAAGAVLGVAAAFAVARVLARLLFGVAPTDPISFLAAGACLVVVTVVATCAPAVRAMRTDLIAALRE